MRDLFEKYIKIPIRLRFKFVLKKLAGHFISNFTA